MVLSILTMFRCLPVSCLGLLAIFLSPARATDVLSYHNDLSSTGQNLTETKLTPGNVNVGSFQKRFATVVDGQVYAQPLYKAAVNITVAPAAGAHDTAFVATEHGSVYAIDAAAGTILWKTSVLTVGLPGATQVIPVPNSDLGSDDLKPEIGITSTPVIDPAAGVIYVVSKTKQTVSGQTAPHYVHTLCKLSLASGAIVGSNIFADTAVGSGFAYSYRTSADASAVQDPWVNGTGDGTTKVNGQDRVYFNGLRELNRPGLVLTGGRIYVAFASHGDNGPYHGWLLAFDAASLKLNGVFNTSPHGGEAGIWQAGGIPAIDSAGNIYFETGNGTFDGVDTSLDSRGRPAFGDYGDCFLKLALDSTTTQANQNINGWGLKVADYFSPYNNDHLTRADTDLGSGAPVLLPDSAGSTAHPHLLLGGGKEGKLYLIDRDMMGGFDAKTDHVVQTQAGAVNGSVDTPAYYAGQVYYVGGYGDKGKSYPVGAGSFAATPDATTSFSYAFPGATPSISANGASNGIVWTLNRATSQLLAHAADDLAHQLWTSADAPGSRDQLDSVVKFAVPTVADGRVLVGTATALVVYGPPAPPPSAPAAPTSLTGQIVSGIQANLAWIDHATNEDGFSIEQSTDGTTYHEIATVGVNTQEISVTGLQLATTYTFRVRAFNSFQTHSFSAYSNPVSVTTAAQPPVLDFSSGFQNSSALLTPEGSAKIGSNGALSLTDGTENEKGAVWTRHQQPVSQFTTEFTFRLTSATADGFTFCLQRSSATATGTGGGGLGYGGLHPSLALKFDVYPASSTTGLYLAGLQPGEDSRSLDMRPAGIDLHSGHLFHVLLTYRNGLLAETVADTQTQAVFAHSYKINLPQAVGGYTAWAGFTGSSGGAGAMQDILSWNYTVIPSAPPAAPSNLSASPASGTQVNLHWQDNSRLEAGFLVERRVPPATTFSKLGVTGQNTTTYMDTQLSPNTVYVYRVRATNSAGVSAPAPAVGVRLPVPPVTPTGAHTTKLTATEIDLAWIDHAVNETSYRVLRASGAGANFVVIGDHLPPNTTRYVDKSKLAPGTRYDYHIQCYNVAGYSDFTGLTVTTPAQ